jgi:hypothetical protein
MKTLVLCTKLSNWQAVYFDRLEPSGAVEEKGARGPMKTRMQVFVQIQ